MFGGPNRMVNHCVGKVYEGTAPKYLNLEKEVRYNFTFRDAPNVLGNEDKYQQFFEVENVEHKEKLMQNTQKNN